MAGELHGFLEREGLAAEPMRDVDIAALRHFLPSADRVRGSVEALLAAGADELDPICGSHDYPVEYRPSLGCVWKWRYLKQSWDYVAAGVRFSDLVPTDLGHAGATGPEIFVEAQLSTGSCLTGGTWYSPRPTIFIARKPIPNFDDPHHFAEEASDWCKARFAEIRAVASESALAVSVASSDPAP